MGYTIDIDTGGTFTDGFFGLDHRFESVKVQTTPHDLTVCFLECIKAGAGRFGVPVEDLLYETDIIRFANTIGTNTIIQRDGSKIGLLVNAGSEGLALNDADQGKTPLILPDMVLGLEEKTSASGEVIQEPDEKQAMAGAQKLIDQGARCLVVALANSEINPQNERRIRQTIKKEYSSDYLGSVPVFLSSDISGRSGLLERINASVLNAYIHAKLVRLLYKAGEDLRRHLYKKNLFIVHNNGAVARVAKTQAINTYNSGPVAGLLGARLTGRLYGAEDLISADMGGTSFDVGYVHQGRASYTLRPEIEGFAVNIPMLSIRAIGAGGGSIAYVRDGNLQVGPQSAGALPGPVSFDLGGTEPTVTDADLILGILDPDYFLGGSLKLNRSKARTMMEEKLAKPLGITVEEAALTVKQKIDQAMGLEIKRLKSEIWPKGLPPLVVYGGAGPAHCCQIAQIAGLKKIILTPFSAVFSAFSSSSMDVGHLYSRRLDLSLEKNQDLNHLAQAVASMKKEAERDMRGEGFPWDQVGTVLELLFRASGNGQEIRLEAGQDFYEDPERINAFIQRANEALAASGQTTAKGMRLTQAVLLAQSPVPHPQMPEYPLSRLKIEQALKGRRRVFWGAKGGAGETPIYDRALLGHGHRLIGPAICESEQTTLLISPGWAMGIDQYNNALLEEVSS
ncbi:MAG: hydantoinase/oxoprolinase family protein [Deltaproteobacteria bacterium]|nr:hydantoinase/oxoprolinase family protein [Deltaproteobacteria bacterium]